MDKRYRFRKSSLTSGIVTLLAMIPQILVMAHKYIGPSHGVLSSVMLVLQVVILFAVIAAGTSLVLMRLNCGVVLDENGIAEINAWGRITTSIPYRLITHLRPPRDIVRESPKYVVEGDGKKIEIPEETPKILSLRAEIVARSNGQVWSDGPVPGADQIIGVYRMRSIWPEAIGLGLFTAVLAIATAGVLLNTHTTAQLISELAGLCAIIVPVSSILYLDVGRIWREKLVIYQDRVERVISGGHVTVRMPISDIRYFDVQRDGDGYVIESSGDRIILPKKSPALEPLRQILNEVGWTPVAPMNAVPVEAYPWEIG